MIKLVSYTYMLSANILNDVKYCEVKNLQSPYVAKINDTVKDDDNYVPVYTCDIPIDIGSNPTALLECIKTKKMWLKI